PWGISHGLNGFSGFQSVQSAQSAAYLRKSSGLAQILGRRNLASFTLFGVVRDGLCTFERPHDETPLLRVQLRELGAEEQNLRRVIDPREDDQYGPRGAVGGTYACAADVKADCCFSSRKQEGCNHGPRPHVLPVDMNIRNDLVDRRKEDDHNTKGDGSIEQMPDGIRTRKQIFKVAGN